MLPEIRKKKILQEVQQHGSVEVSELAEALDVSAMTVRRDLAELDEQGLINRIHGGAELPAVSFEPQFEEKISLNAGEKTKIAEKALQLIYPGQAVGIAGGTTCQRIAQKIAGESQHENLTVVTNSLPVAQVLHQTPNPAHPRVLLTGGERTPSDALVGPLAESSVANLYTDLLFIGTHGATKQGLLTPNLLEAQTNRALIHSAHKVVAVFDGSKWGTAGLARYAEWGDVHTVITTDDLPPEALTFLTDSVSEVIVA